MKEYRMGASSAWCAAWAMAGCLGGVQPAADDERFELRGDRATDRGAARTAALSASELRTYASDRRYVRSLMPRGKAIALDHADPRQHRFAVMRMRMAGMTPETSALFQQMDDLAVSQQVRGLAPGSVVELAAQGSGRMDQHDILQMSIGAGTEATSIAVLSRRGSLSYGYVDSALWDEVGNPVSDVVFAEVFGNMPWAAAQSVSNVALLPGSRVEADSFLVETLFGTDTPRESYIIDEPQLVGEGAVLTTPVVEHPEDLDGNGYIDVCLNRRTGLCDYDSAGGDRTLKLPLKGSIAVTGPDVTLDAAAIESYKAANGPHPGQIYVTMGNIGGICAMLPGTAGMSMVTFWQKVTVSPAENPTTLSWDLSNAELSNTDSRAQFSSECAVPQDTAYLTMELQIPYVNRITGIASSARAAISNADFAALLAPPNLSFGPPIRIVDGSAATGR